MGRAGGRVGRRGQNVTSIGVWEWAEDTLGIILLCMTRLIFQYSSPIEEYSRNVQLCEPRVFLLARVVPSDDNNSDAARVTITKREFGTTITFRRTWHMLLEAIMAHSIALRVLTSHVVVMHLRRAVREWHRAHRIEGLNSAHHVVTVAHLKRVPQHIYLLRVWRDDANSSCDPVLITGS